MFAPYSKGLAPKFPFSNKSYVAVHMMGPMPDDTYYLPHPSTPTIITTTEIKCETLIADDAGVGLFSVPIDTLSIGKVKARNDFYFNG